MVRTFDLEVLLANAGAKPTACGRRWSCPLCGKAERVSVDSRRGLYHCFTANCPFSGNAISLARSLGVGGDLPEWQRVAARSIQMTNLVAKGERVRRDRIGRLANNYRENMGVYCELRCRLECSPRNSAQVEKALLVYSKLIELDAEMLLLEVMPLVEAVEFLASPKRNRHEVIMGIVSRGGVATGERFFELRQAVATKQGEL